MTDGMSRRSIREVQADAVRERLIDASIAQIERGEDPTMRSVAAEAGVSERTIYRYFESRDALAEACRVKIAPRAGVPLPESARDLEAYAKSLYETFEANAGLIIGLATTPSLRSDFRRSRGANLLALRALLDREHPRAPARERAAAAASLRAQLSGGGWVYLRYSCGLTNEDVIAAAQWSIRVALARLAASSRKR